MDYYRAKVAHQLAEKATELFSHLPTVAASLLLHEECAGNAWEVEPFSGLSWQDLSYEFLSYNSSALAFFSPEAYRYYFPAFATSSLSRLRDGAEDVVNPLVYSLDPTTQNDLELERFQISKFQQFNCEETRFIGDFLSFVCDLGQHYVDAKHATAALQYWRNRLRGSRA